MGFNAIKEQAINCILLNNVQHEFRDSSKNLYANGDISDDEVVKIIQSCHGDCYEKQRHHFYNLDIHILKPKGKYDGYYVKFYFLEPDVWFISVHLSEFR
jgi:hypothetical protein